MPSRAAIWMSITLAATASATAFFTADENATVSGVSPAFPALIHRWKVRSEMPARRAACLKSIPSATSVQMDACTSGVSLVSLPLPLAGLGLSVLMAPYPTRRPWNRRHAPLLLARTHPHTSATCPPTGRVCGRAALSSWSGAAGR